jgi:hypothetical protein
VVLTREVPIFGRNVAVSGPYAAKAAREVTSAELISPLYAMIAALGALKAASGGLFILLGGLFTPSGGPLMARKAALAPAAELFGLLSRLNAGMSQLFVPRGAVDVLRGALNRAHAPDEGRKNCTPPPRERLSPRCERLSVLWGAVNTQSQLATMEAQVAVCPRWAAICSENGPEIAEKGAGGTRP